MTDLNGKTALITGASRGLGAAVAQEMAQAGAHVIAVARTIGALEELDDLIQAAGGQATLVPMDLTDNKAIQSMCLSIHGRWGGLDYWMHTSVHAAPLSPANHIDSKDMKKSIEGNVTMAADLIQSIDPLLRAKSGTAVHVDDAIAGQKFFGAYGATKAAQKALFESWAIETTQTGPRVLHFTPNPMPTATRARFYPGENRDALSTCKVEALRLLELL